jgi:lipopolysaccharide transport system permease protein
VLLFGHWPDWQSLAVAMLIGCVVAVLGFGFFQKTRRGFADVL